MRRASRYRLPVAGSSIVALVSANALAGENAPARSSGGASSSGLDVGYRPRVRANRPGRRVGVAAFDPARKMAPARSGPPEIPGKWPKVDAITPLLKA